jgi:DNA-binding transcriptional MerR regulator
MKKFLSIQEFSKISGVETSTLRYWDEIGLFTPIRRNPENNYRYYDLPQILALNFVTTLSELEIPLKTIAELRQERDPENFLQVLEKRERQLDMELRDLRLRSSIIHARQELIRYGLKVDETEVSVLTCENKTLILWPRNEYKEGDTFVEPMAKYIQQTSKQHINLSFPVGGYYDDMDSFKKSPDLPNHFISIDPLGTHIRKEGEYLSGFARGYYGELGDLPERMAAYAEKNAINVSGPVYVLYLHDETCSQDPSQYLAQAFVAVTRSKRR